MVEKIDVAAETIVGVRDRVPFAALPGFFESAFTRAAEGIADVGVITGPPVAVYQGVTDGVSDVLAGFPAVVSAPELPGGLSSVTLPGGSALTEDHLGSYDTLEQTYDVIHAEFAARHLPVPDLMWESYLVGPESGPDPAHWRTRVTYPLPAGG